MRSRLRAGALAITGAVIVLAVGLTGRSEAGFRPAALPPLEAAEALHAGENGLEGPTPPLPILVSTLGVAIAPHAPDPVRGPAAGGALAIALALALIILAGYRLGGPLAAGGAGLAMLLVPGTLFHARTAGPEAAIILAWALLVFAPTRRHRAAMFVAGTTGLGACIAATHEGIWMLLPWLAAVFWLAPRSSDEPALAGTIRLGRPHLPEIACAVLAPLAVLWLWPHLETDALQRWIAVVYEPLAAPHPPWIVLGEVRDQTLTRAPNVLQGLLAFMLRIPLPVGALALLGGALAIRSARGNHRVRRAVHAVLLLSTLALIHALNGSPYYAHTDGFAAAIPPLALLAGIGGAAVIHAVADLRPKAPPRAARLAQAVVAVLLVGAASFELAAVWPGETAYHNALVGGAPGAASRGIETRTDALLPSGLVDWMNERLPKGARVAFVPDDAGLRGLMDGLKLRGIVRDDLESAEAYHATHLVISRMPGHPLYGSLLSWVGDPLASNDDGGVRRLGIYRY